MTNVANREESAIEILKVLDRGRDLRALDALAHALHPEPTDITMRETIIAFDANVFLRLSNHARSEDIIDSLRSSHGGAMILPGQVVQEFWNNQLQAVDSLAASIKKKHEALKADVEKIDKSVEQFSARFLGLLNEFQESFGYIYDENTIRRMRLFLDLLLERSIVPYAPRNAFAQLASTRKRTKTPPGFKDEGDGDFYVWVDMLLGLDQLKRSGSNFRRVVLVSQDRKIDWSREGVPHPILSAEVKALSGASFEIWTIDNLARHLLD